jgi:hypothetical protein
MHRTLADLLRRLNPVLRGWCTYFRHGVSKRTFRYVEHFAFWRIFAWLRKRHPGLTVRTMVRRHLPNWEISDDGINLFRPADSPSCDTADGAARSPPHGRARHHQPPNQRPEHVESRMRLASHVRFGGRAGETEPPKGGHGAPARLIKRRPGVASGRAPRWSGDRTASTSNRAPLHYSCGVGVEAVIDAQHRDGHIVEATPPGGRLDARSRGR